ncbi:aldo/keto reductase [soil metagenome]
MGFPKFIYGTAWKVEATIQLVKLAIKTGFRAIDTANQPKHYSEVLVGQALLELSDENIMREQLFLQTKFTPANGHDERIPYDPNADYEVQVLTSFSNSLEHLHTSYVDSFLLHGPYTWPGLSDADWSVWQAMEKLYDSGQTKSIGISNVNIEQLKLLVNHAHIKPMVVQNRCFASTGWDREVREFCRTHHIMYQGFSLLTANCEVLQHNTIKKLAQHLGCTTEQMIFRFAMDVGITPLTGTSSEIHMQQDLHLDHILLSNDELMSIQTLMLE